ncbi:MAG: fasciclin domain-containing protein [Steroidobacteraceae bacterium]
MSRIAARALIAAGALALGLTTAVAHAKSPVPGKPGKANIVEIALATNAASGEFDYLIAAATCPYFEGAIVRLLSSKTYTLFAPTDAAFENLQRALGVENPSPEVTCTLPQAVVFDILAYHVTEGRRFSNSVFNKRSDKMVEMLNDQYIVTKPNLTITDIAGQTASPVLPLVNINASNGVIHVIDTVLLPFTPQK